MKIATIAAREGTLHCSVYDMNRESLLLSVAISHIGQTDCTQTTLVFLGGKQLEFNENRRCSDHEAAASVFLENLLEYDLHDVDVLAHHIMHGGTKYAHPVVLQESVIHHLYEIAHLAASENPPSLVTALSLMKHLPSIKHIAVFDTAFHATIPDHIRTYAIPKELGELKKFGFYGVTHHYVSKVARRMLKEKDADRYTTSTKLIHAHLNGSTSICAILDGKSVNTTMGFSSIPGPVMATKSGDIDPGAILYLAKKYKKSPEEMMQLLHKRSGLVALTGQSALSDIYRDSMEGSTECDAAIERLTSDLAGHISKLLPDLGGVDALVFSGSTVDNCPWLLGRVMKKLSYLGAHVSEEKMKQIRLLDGADLTGSESMVNVLYVRPKEHLEVARLAKGLMSRAVEAVQHAR
jgi:acetate kinase